MTTPDRFRQVEDLFHRALELAAGERPDFLERECPDPQVRQQVERLLKREERGAILETTPWGTSPAADDGPELGTCIGPYRLVQRIGEGGMGLVFEAEQEAPVRRSVALKLIRLGLASTEFIARFQAERQALALMEHPCIAQVFDAGASEEGHPYFVMELVRGAALTSYCDEHGLNVEQRIRLLQAICAGVQHAHQKGIIHRDLKPSNILVTESDGAPLPKIIDFGIAKTIGDGLAEHKGQTRAGQFVGTPEYMSPEQARLDPAGVDTRSDVYSLGVLLYKLLVGTTPHDPDTLQDAGFDEMRRVIREVDPVTPSTRLTRSGDTAAEVARHRGTDPAALRKHLQGDLDWITMKALDKDPARRYASAAELAADLERFLRYQPVLAGPPGAGYRTRKFVRRHRLAVVAASLILLAILAGTAAAAMGFFRARRSEARALAESAASGEVTDFLVELFEESDPNKTRGDSLTAREVLDRGVEKIESELQDQPLVQARLMTVMGRVYRGLGRYDAARPLLEDGVSHLEPVVEEDDPRLADSLFQLGRLELMQGRYPAAEERYRRALEIARARLEPGHPTIGFYTTQLGAALQFQGRAADARALLEEALQLQEAALGLDHIDTAWTLYALAWNRMLAGRLQEAREMYEQLVPVFERELGDDSPDLAFCLNDFATLLMEMREPDAALPFLERALAVRKRALGPEHAFVAQTLDSLGSLCFQRGSTEDARSYYEQALAIRERLLGPEHPHVASSLENLGLVSMKEGDHDAARREIQRAREIKEKALGPEHADVANSIHNLAVNERVAGRFAEALPLQLRANELLEKGLGPESPKLAAGLQALGYIHWARKEWAQALEAMVRALTIYEKVLGPEHGTVGLVRADSAALRCYLGDVDAARQLFDRAIALREQDPRTEDLAIARHLMDFGDALLAAGLPDEAQPLLERSLQIRRAHPVTRQANVWSSLSSLGGLFTATGEYEQAEAHFEESVQVFEEIRGAENPKLANILDGYSALLRATGRIEEARVMEARAARLREKGGLSRVRIDRP